MVTHCGMGLWAPGRRGGGSVRALSDSGVICKQARVVFRRPISEIARARICTMRVVGHVVQVEGTRRPH